MPQNDVSIGLDVGTSAVRIAAVQKKSNAKNPQILGAGSYPISGLRKGMIVDIEEAANSIETAISEFEQNFDIEFRGVFTNIGGINLGVFPSRGVVAVSRADSEISDEDIERVIKASQAVSLPANREVVHALPQNFHVDGETGIKEAVGMQGVRLEVETLLVLGYSPMIKNLAKVMNLVNLEINDFMITALADAEAVLTPKQKELGVMVLDIGAGTTDLGVFEEGNLIHAAVLPIGSGHITNDIAIGLRLSIDLAERIKIEYGTSISDDIGKKETIDISKMSDDVAPLSRKELADIIEARLCEIFDLANKELKKIGRQKLLPAGVVLVGGGAKMPAIVNLAKREFGLPCQIGYSLNLDGMIDRVDDPAFACSVGLALLGVHDYNQNERKLIPSSVLGLLGGARKLFKIFLP